MAKADVAGLVEKRQELERRRAESSQLAAKLEEQRKFLLVGAHTGDAGAQEKLQKVNSELQAATRDAFDIADAIEQAGREIIALEAAAKLAARRQQREGLRALLQGRINDGREQRIAALLEKLEIELSELHGNTKGIAAGLRAFHPRLEGVVSNLLDREGLSISNLRGYGLRAGGGFAVHAGYAPEILANILRALDCLPIEKEAAVGGGA